MNHAMNPLQSSKFQQLLADIANIGSTTGFKYFTLQLNGKEELLCSILNSPSIYSNENAIGWDDIYDTNNISKKRRPPLLSQMSQSNLLKESGGTGSSLPPASPPISCISNADETLFLIGAYPLYDRPYVWIRNNHSRFMVDSDLENEKTKSSPLRLKSSLEWEKRDIRIWDIIAELVTISCRPSPRNPFAIDIDYYDNSPLVESTLATGSTIRILQEIVTSSHPYNDKVWDDLQQLTKRHFEDLEAVVGNWYSN
ncbi:hypothetical protein TrispH2_000937 [Trichoplax sp. H2]|nr:hypothetical protein TrispH2_000937 [Trichoplax sp. H2]|eukprot:RDD46646.1 hypothetical protein TrispH2_000937 [Trichoplax sp. H2]